MILLLSICCIVASVLAPQPPENTITHDIGPQGTNDPQDIVRLQSLLNQVPLPVGGPNPLLEVDGIFGPITEKALEHFHRIQFGKRIKTLRPSDKAMARLLEYAEFQTIERAGPPIAWGRVVTPTFKRRLLEVATHLEFDPNSLMAAMAFETAHTFSPAIENPSSRATGLIQFLPSTARSLGTTIEELAEMSNVEQLDWVQKYFQPYRGRCHTLGDIYMAILWPRAVNKEDSFILFDEVQHPKAYQGNRGLDANRDGKVTKGEATAPVELRLKLGLDEWKG